MPDLQVEGDADDAQLLIVGFGGTYGHLHAAMDEMREMGKKVALAHFRYINPLPKNTADVLKRYPKVVVAEQNMGQLAAYLRMKVDNFVPMQFNQVKGQPFVVEELVNIQQVISKKDNQDGARDVATTSSSQHCIRQWQKLVFLLK